MTPNTTGLHRNPPAQHGTTTLYDNHGCRCDACSAAKCAYAKKRRYLMDTGQWNPWGDLDAVRAHLARHKALGVGASRVADAAGVARATVWAIQRHEAKRITRATADKILAVSLKPTPNAKVAAVGSRRRVHALMCMGYTQTVIRERAGVTRAPMIRIAAGAPLTVARIAESIMRVYDELSMVPAPVSQSSKVARTHARKMGYLPPLAWDDALIDLPEDELAAECARQVAMWDRAELAEAYRAYLKKGDRSPLMVAGAAEYRRLLRSARAEHASAA